MLSIIRISGRFVPPGNEVLVHIVVEGVEVASIGNLIVLVEGFM